MKNILLSALLITSTATVSAQTFTAGNYYENPEFWELTLTPLDDGRYQADVYSYYNEFKAIVKRQDNDNGSVYEGLEEFDKQPIVITAVETPCQANGKSGRWSHRVKGGQRWGEGKFQFEVCGGDWLGDEEDDNSRAVSQRAHEKAKELNTQGYRLYKKKNYADAIMQFYRATQADGNYALAHYNLASTLALEFGHCELEEQAAQEGYEIFLELSDSDVVFKELRKAIKLDPKRLQRSQIDPDFAEVRQSYRYYRDILGYRNDNEEQLRQMLQNIDWESVGVRLLHVEPFSRLIFHPDGRVQIKKTHEAENNIPPWRYTYQNGRYRLNDGVITLEFDGQSVEGRLSEHGTLYFNNESKLLPSNLYRFARDNCGV